MRARVAIVGGGVMGNSIAMHLAQRLDPLADPVLLFERAPALGAGSSGRSGAILRQHYADREVARMARDSLATYSSFEVRTGRSVGFRKTGVLTLAGPRAPEWIERVRANVAMLASIGVDTRLVDADEMRELVPGIEVDDGALGAWEPNAGFVDPLETLESFSALARSRGAVTRLGVPVEALIVENGRVVGLETAEGGVEAESVIAAAGPWTRALLERAEIELPLRVVRPEQHFLAMPVPVVPSSALLGGSAPLPSAPAAKLEEPHERIERELEDRARAEPPSAHPVLIDLEHGYYTRCEPRHVRTRVGRTDYAHDRVLEDPDELDETVGPEFERWARGVLTRRLPVYRGLADADSQAAWYTLTPDSQALLGPVPGLEGAFVATGFSGHGFKLAPSVGEGLSQMVLGDAVTAFDQAFFAPDRFAKKGARVAWGSGAFGL